MKLLLDQNCSAGAAEILRSSGMDVVHTREVGLATADDRDILQWCRTLWIELSSPSTLTSTRISR
jgi:predicted nuclease of predicted toxin-antitoxin system